MPNQIYTSSQGWIPQAEEIKTFFPSGLEKTEKAYIAVAGGSDSIPDSVLNGLNVFPEPVLQTGEDGFTRAIVTSYTCPQSGAAPYVEETKVFKTGTAIWDNVLIKQIKVGDGFTEVPYLDRQTFDFQYLAEKINKQSASITGTNVYEPSGEPEITIINTPLSGGTLIKAWKLVSYQLTNYGNIKETFFSHEGSAIYYKYTNNTTLNNLTPPPVPQP